MAINSRKISSFPVLSDLTGDEYLMVAYNHKSYRIPTSLLISNSIKSISQTINDGDENDNPILVTLSDGKKFSFNVKNGKKGSKGEQGERGEKGLKGDSGIAIYNNTDLSKLIVTDMETDISESELAEMILSAAAGVSLNTKLDALKEEYLDSQNDYDQLSAAGKIAEDTKYLIFEE